MSDIICTDVTSSIDFIGIEMTPGPAGTSAPNITATYSITTTATVLAGSTIYVNLTAAGVVVVLNPSGIGSGVFGMTVKLIGASIGAGSSCTINPMVAGSHIESRVAPGTLTTSLILNSPGDEVTLGSPNGTDLYY